MTLIYIILAFGSGFLLGDLHGWWKYYRPLAKRHVDMLNEVNKTVKVVQKHLTQIKEIVEAMPDQELVVSPIQIKK